jgi:hypothetical protein
MSTLGTRSAVHVDLGAGVIELEENSHLAIRRDLRPASGQHVMAAAGSEQQ